MIFAEVVVKKVIGISLLILGKIVALMDVHDIEDILVLNLDRSHQENINQSRLI